MVKFPDEESVVNAINDAWGKIEEMQPVVDAAMALLRKYDGQDDYNPALLRLLDRCRAYKEVECG